MTAIAANPPPMEYFKAASGDNGEGSSSSPSASSTSSVSASSRPPPAFHRSASSPSMSHCWAMKTSLHPGVIPMQPTIIKEVSKDDSDVSPDDIIVDPKTHHTYRKGRLIGKGGFAKVFEVSRICTGEPMASDNNETLADKIIDKEVFSRRSTSKDKVKREISLHKDLIHPNIVRFFNFFSDGKYK